MKFNYLHDYIILLERVLSFGYKNGYSSSFIERSISYYSYFLKVEDDKRGLPPIAYDETLIEDIYSVNKPNMFGVPMYSQCTWAAEAYLRIQGETKLTFESIFLYIPIDEMYLLYVIYHEMDFSQIVKEFKERFEKKSVLAKLSEKCRLSLSELSEKIGISQNTLLSLSSRRRSIGKTNFETVFKIAKLFDVRLETITETKIE